MEWVFFLSHAISELRVGFSSLKSVPHLKVPFWFQRAFFSCELDGIFHLVNRPRLLAL